MENEQLNVTPQEGVTESILPVPPIPAVSKTEWFKHHLQTLTSFASTHKKIVIPAFLILVLLAGIFFYIFQTKHYEAKQFTTVYSFVPEKISKSAFIPINLPEGVDEETARASITFNPTIEGKWQTEDIEKVLVFEPKKPMRSGVYYAVNMDTGAIQMSGDFYVDEDPKIEAIFPNSESEAHEDSEITIVFNRPMVPLTTLANQELLELPIVISPKTPGRFKWVSSRNLQFIPETTLIPSSEYTVEIKNGLTSVDGLAVAPMVHNFKTRPLRYEYMSEEQVGYRSPIIIDFNQPVDIDKTKKEIKVSKQGGSAVAIEVEYGEETFYDHKSHKMVSHPDQSKLFVYQKKDAHGRGKLWDFDTTYEVSIAKATPLAGTTDLAEGKQTTVSVPSIVEAVTAQSEKTSLVRPDLFDPAGTLTVTFYDDVQKDRSDIQAKGLRSVAYAERCKQDASGETIFLGSECEKEPDTKTLIFSFDNNVFRADEAFTLDLKRIITPDGFRINAEPISINVKTYPSFRVIQTFPEQNSGGAALNGIVVCSNTPLKNPGEAGISSYIKTDGYIVFGRWSESLFLETESLYDRCAVGEFETKIPYGLLPETDYQLGLTLTDSFNQTAGQQLSFKTGAPEEQYTRFHNMQQQYNVTTPDKTKLTYAVENLEYVDMHICRLQPEVFLERTIERDERYTAARSDGCLQVVNKVITLPKRYWVNNYFQVNLAEYFSDTRGQYIITFSNPSYKEAYSNNQLYDRTYVSVTNLAVGRKAIEYKDEEWSWSASNNPAKNKVLENRLGNASNLYWVNDSRSLAAVSGAMVTQYEGGYEKDFFQRDSATTNGQGIAQATIQRSLAGAVIRNGADAAVISDWTDSLSWASAASDASRTYVYTDRPIYRPGQTAYIRGIDRIGFDGSYEIWNTKETKLTVFDSQGNSVYETALPISDYGTFKSEFAIPKNAPLGTYRIEVFGQSFWFDVEEYVPAAFKLETSANQEEYTDGDTVKLDVQADYYFGVPLSEGTVSYSVTAQDYYFDRYADEYFNFGEAWYNCYSCGYGDDFLYRGETTLDENGHGLIERTLNLKDYFSDIGNEGSKLVTVSITTKDINGRSVSMQKSFVVHKGDFYIGAKTDEYYTSVNTPVTVRAKTVDQQGKPISISGIEQKLFKVNWETFKRQEVDGGFYYQSEKKLQEISHGQFNTDNNGSWNGTVSIAEEGEYEIHITKTDKRGNQIKTVSHLYIYGDAAVPVPPNNNYELDLEVERRDLDVGDTGTLLIKSPYKSAKVLITAERGTVYDYWIVNLTGGLYEHTFPIKKEYAPNVNVSALLLAGTPEVKFGSVEYKIGSSEHELKVNVTANKTHYLPGEVVTLMVDTKDAWGNPVPAEVSLAVADLSVLALKGNPKKNPALFFYDGFPLSVTTASNIKNILYEVDIPLGTKGGGGASPDDLAKKKRGVFKDTAYWEADVRTDQNGKAVVTFTLPDNLTTWQVESLGVTKDTKLGVDYDEFTTKKDLMAVPLKPRFVVPGDTFSLGASVFNQTDSDSSFKVKLESTTLEFTGKQSDEVFVKKGESKTVYFEVTAPKNIRAGEHKFIFTAENDSLTDSVEQIIPITTNTTYETVATANFTKENKSAEYLYVPKEVVSGEGGLTINANATMAVFMADALTYMVTYPYGCSEQLASSLSTIGTLTKALTLPNVEGKFETIEYEGVTYTVDQVVKDGLEHVYETQTYDGGFAYYKGLSPDLPLTIHVLVALGDLKAAGYEVRDDVLRRAAAYVETEAKNQYNNYPATNQETVILAEYALRQVNNNTKTSLSEIIVQLVDDNQFLNEKISSMTLAYLAILTAEDFSQSGSKRVYKVLTNRIDVDGRGAYLKSLPTTNLDYFETPAKNTALLLKAFSAHKDEHPELANVLRWLLASRDYDGVWGGTHNTFVVVDAMIDYLAWQKETESNFTLRGLLDSVEIFGFEFNPSNIFSTFTKFIPINDIAREKLVPVTLEREDHNGRQNNLYYDMTLKYYLPVEGLPPRDEGITITRSLYSLTDTAEKTPLEKTSVGEVVRGKLTVTIPGEYQHVAIEDVIPAGFEIVNFNLETEDKSLQNEASFGSVPKDDVSSGWLSYLSNFHWFTQSAQVFGSQGFGGSYGNNTRELLPTHVESHDDRVFVYVDRLSPGVYEYEYFLRALVPGTFQHLPARAEELYFPEVFGRTEGGVFEITPAG